MIDLVRFVSTLGNIDYGDKYVITMDRPCEEKILSQLVLIVGVDFNRVSILVVDSNAYDLALRTSEPLIAVGKGIATMKEFLTSKKDDEFADKANKTATSVSYSIAKNTVHASWVPYCWIAKLARLSKAPQNVLQALRESHPPVGFRTKN